MLAVLEEAVTTFQRNVFESRGRGRRLFLEVAAWIAADDTASAFSFVSVCQALDLDPSYVRAGLRRLRQRGAPPPRSGGGSPTGHVRLCPRPH